MKVQELNYITGDELLFEQTGGLKFISKQRAINRKMFGPVYHGTSEDNLALIKQEGFRTFIDIARSGNVRHGYELANYFSGTGNPAPVHHLGYGVYFTTSKSIAKQFNNNSMRGIIEFYLNVPRLETINFAAPNTMMQWWMKYGYDMPSNWQRMPRAEAEQIRMKATLKMTRNIKREFDAVWFKGKTMYKTLDGDQVCVYDPKRIYAIDPRMSKGMDIGGKVVHSQIDHPGQYNYQGERSQYAPPPNIKGVIVAKRPIPPQYHKRMAEIGRQVSKKSKNWIEVKWAKGGTHYNYTEVDLKPVS